MSIKTETTMPVVIPFALSEETINRFNNAIDDQLQKGVEQIVICCSEFDKVSSANIALLMGAYKKCRLRSVQIQLTNVSDGFINILKLLELNELFLINDMIQKAHQTAVDPIPMSDSIQTLSLEINVDSTSIDSAMEHIMLFMLDNEIVKQIAFQIQIIFYEVATNIRCYSGLTRQDIIEFKIVLFAKKAILSFKDSGKPFDIRSKIRQDGVLEIAKAGQSRGYGITMIYKLSNKIEYKRLDNSINEVTIKKSWE